MTTRREKPESGRGRLLVAIEWGAQNAEGSDHQDYQSCPRSEVSTRQGVKARNGPASTVLGQKFRDWGDYRCLQRDGENFLKVVPCSHIGASG